ncbi:TPA: acyl carrier protein [Candidatus Micrarchaeota archaeon]|nr:acyl carrier protein [Candidatus Micrarchaeota archaeon]
MAMELLQLKQWLISWFEKNTDMKKDEIENGVSISYFEKGWIDSLKFISFVSDIEDEFGIRFSNEEFQNREFSTINGLAEIIQKKTGEK